MALSFISVEPEKERAVEAHIIKGMVNRTRTLMPHEIFFSFIFISWRLITLRLMRIISQSNLGEVRNLLGQQYLVSQLDVINTVRH